MSYKLFDHQKTMLELMTEHDRFLILAEVGVGKTLSADVMAWRERPELCSKCLEEESE